MPSGISFVFMLFPYFLHLPLIWCIWRHILIFFNSFTRHRPFFFQAFSFIFLYNFMTFKSLQTVFYFFELFFLWLLLTFFYHLFFVFHFSIYCFVFLMFLCIVFLSIPLLFSIDFFIFLLYFCNFSYSYFWNLHTLSDLIQYLLSLKNVLVTLLYNRCNYRILISFLHLYIWIRCGGVHDFNSTKPEKLKQKIIRRYFEF